MDNGACSYRRFLGGDEQAFDRILLDYFDGLVFFVNRYVRDIHAAEDIAIDVFSDLLVHRGRYDFRVYFKTYLFMLGRSRALNYIKHRSKLTFVPLSDAENIPSEQLLLEEKLLLDERKLAVNKALSELPEELRLVVHLVYFEGLSREDTARVMKKTVKQVYNLLYRAKNALRASLGEEGDCL